MSSEPKCGVNSHFATHDPSDQEVVNKLEAISMLQQLGYTVAVAPEHFDGDS